MLRCRRGATARQEVMGAARSVTGGPLASPEDTRSRIQAPRQPAALQVALLSLSWQHQQPETEAHGLGFNSAFTNVSMSAVVPAALLVHTRAWTVWRGHTDRTNSPMCCSMLPTDWWSWGRPTGQEDIPVQGSGSSMSVPFHGNLEIVKNATT